MENWLKLILGIAIFLILYNLPIIWKFLQSFFSSKEKRKSIKAKSTPDTVSANHPPAGHANSSSEKSKRNWFSKIFWTMTTIVLTVAVLAFLAWALPFIKKMAIEFLEPSPQYKMVLVYNRTVSVNLDSDWSDANTVYLEKGEKCTFKDATVSFCVHNLTGQMVCGDAYTDPDLPPGSGNEKMWFKSKDGPHGTIEVVISRREKQLIK